MLRDKHTFFVDRSLGGIVVAGAIERVILENESVQTHDGLFRQDTDDDVWLRHVGKHNWIALSKDDAILKKNAPALCAIVDYGVRLFVLTNQDMKGEQMGALFASALPKMRKILAKFDGPFIAQINGAGIIKGPLTEKRIVELVWQRHKIRI